MTPIPKEQLKQMVEALRSCSKRKAAEYSGYSEEFSFDEDLVDAAFLHAPALLKWAEGMENDGIEFIDSKGVRYTIMDKLAPQPPQPEEA